jgi:hypothetical protein
LLNQLREVRHLPFADELREKLRVHAVNAEDNQPVVTVPTRFAAFVGDQKDAANYEQQPSQRQKDPLQIFAPCISKMTNAAAPNQAARLWISNSCLDQRFGFSTFLYSS